MSVDLYFSDWAQPDLAELEAALLAEGFPEVPFLANAIAAVTVELASMPNANREAIMISLKGTLERYPDSSLGCIEAFQKQAQAISAECLAEQLRLKAMRLLQQWQEEQSYRVNSVD